MDCNFKYFAFLNHATFIEIKHRYITYSILPTGAAKLWGFESIEMSGVKLTVSNLNTLHFFPLKLLDLCFGWSSLPGDSLSLLGCWSCRFEFKLLTDITNDIKLTEDSLWEGIAICHKPQLDGITSCNSGDQIFESLHLFLVFLELLVVGQVIPNVTRMIAHLDHRLMPFGAMMHKHCCSVVFVLKMNLLDCKHFLW